MIHYHTLSFLQRNNTRDKVANSVQNEESSNVNEETPIIADAVAVETTNRDNGM